MRLADPAPHMGHLFVPPLMATLLDIRDYPLFFGGVHVSPALTVMHEVFGCVRKINNLRMALTGVWT